MTPFYLITGFLGSGKTTLLQNILTGIGSKYKIAVIQNELASTGINGEILRKTGRDFKLVEINSGSVFCVCQLGNFIQILHKLLTEYEPELIFLESSGLADPLNIAELLQNGNIQRQTYLAGIITIVDALHFFKGRQMIQRVRHQIMVADFVLINKTDIDQSDPEKLEQNIRELNPFAQLIRTSFCKIDMEEVLFNHDTSFRNADLYQGKHSAGRPDINVCVLRTHKKIAFDETMQLVKQLQKDCIRIKGFINTNNGSTFAVQSVFNQTDIVKLGDYCGPTELIVFSHSITVRDLQKMFADL